MSDDALLGRTLVELADTLVDDFDVVELLTLLADRCIDVLDVAAAGLMLAGASGDLRVMASSSEAMRLLELFELQNHEGPCLDCFRSGERIVNQSLVDADSRWPKFAAEGRSAGFHVVHAISMRLRGEVVGALNLFDTVDSALPRSGVDGAQALADVATIAILQSRAALEAQRVNDQLQNALNSRVVIEQAKGMVAERLGLDMERAFTVLRHHTRQHNLRLVDLARDVIDGHMSATALDPVPSTQQT